MIYHLKGILSKVGDDFVVIEAGGVGYQVFIPTFVRDTLPDLGETTLLYTYHHIREDSQLLFGFLTLEDRALFLLMLSVSGIGPKVGVKILSSVTRNQFIQAVMEENLVILTQIPGVGKKMAERIIVELKDKIQTIYKTDIADFVNTSSGPSAISSPIKDDITLALRTLGYSSEEVKRAFVKLGATFPPETSLESGIKLILKQL